MLLLAPYFGVVYLLFGKITLDRTISLSGSTNLDLRSFNLNYENDVLLRDDELTSDILARQLDYVRQSDHVTLDEVRQWSYARRIWNNLIATAGPIL